MTYGHHYRLRLQEGEQAQEPPPYNPPPVPPQAHRQPTVQRFNYFDHPVRRDVNVKNVTVPLVLVITGAASIIFATYVLTSNMADIKYGVQTMKDQLVAYMSKSSEQISRIEKEMDGLKASGWSVKDHALWCSQEEVANPNWRCVPGAGSPASQPAPPSLSWGSSSRPGD